MSIISPISSTLYNPIYVAPVIPAAAAAQPADAVLNTITQVNANGTITTITTYANGSINSETTIDPNAPVSVSPNGYGLIAGDNTGQIKVLLDAQQQISISHLGS